MRPRRYFCVYNEGYVIGVYHGQKAAKEACGGKRIYQSFRTEIAAQEHAAWHNYARHVRDENERRERHARMRARGQPVW